MMDNLLLRELPASSLPEAGFKIEMNHCPDLFLRLEIILSFSGLNPRRGGTRENCLILCATCVLAHR